ncbi:MAG: hypothetical protein WAV40_01545 [Microgenomates group bacterium]
MAVRQIELVDQSSAPDGQYSDLLEELAQLDALKKMANQTTDATGLGEEVDENGHMRR